MPQENKDGVKPEGKGEDAPTSNKPENEALDNVKPNQPGESSEAHDQKPDEKKETPPVEDKSVSQLQEQVENLNKALKEERDSKKSGSEESNQKIEELKNELDQTKSFIQRIQGAISPEEKGEEESEKEFLTRQEAEELFKSKQEEFVKETQEQKRQEVIKNEIKELTDEWNGKEGKPKYDDDEMLKWQKENELLYLTPKQAFRERFHNDIIDYEAKKRMSNNKNIQDVEKPSSGGTEHQPNESNLPKTDLETRSAVLEAMEELDKE